MMTMLQSMPAVRTMPTSPEARPTFCSPALSMMMAVLDRAKKLTQAELAVMVGVSERKLASWERGETNILFEDAYKCALALGCDVNTLCGWQSEVSEEIAGDEFEKELVNSYRSSTPEWQDHILKTARSSAVMSKEMAERPAHEAEGRRAV